MKCLYKARKVSIYVHGGIDIDSFSTIFPDRILELFWQFSILEMFWQFGILELFWQFGILELFWQFGIFVFHFDTYNRENFHTIYLTIQI